MTDDPNASSQPSAPDDGGLREVYRELLASNGWPTDWADSAPGAPEVVVVGRDDNGWLSGAC